MGRVLLLIWSCKVFLTGASAWRYCSEGVFTPICCASAFYAFAIFSAIFFTYNRKNAFRVVNTQEDIYLKQLEEGLGERFTVVNQKNGTVYSSVRRDEFQWQNTFKEKHS
jgi:hypothetical protein